MRAQLLYKVGDLRLEEVPKPEVGREDFLVAIRACGVCPTDYRKYTTGDHGVPHWPFNMGHEWAGDIVEVGKDVKGFEVGTRIAMVNYGGYVDYFKVTPEQVVWGRRQGDRIALLPENVSYEEGTFMEPFADCIYSVQRAELRLGDTLALVGDGQMGLQHAIIAKLMGLKMIVTGHHDDRLKLATKLGADAVVNSYKEDAVARVREFTDGKGADGVCVTAAAGKAVEEALGMVKKTGNIVLFSGFKKGTTVTFDPNVIHYGEVVLTGAYGVGLKHQNIGLFQRAVDLIGTGTAPVAQLVTHRYPLEELETALKAVGSREALKAVINIQ